MSASREGLSVLGLRLIFIGFLLSFVGFALITMASLIQIPGSPPPSPSSSIVIFIGPIPIVIGSGPQGPILIIAGLLIAALMVLLTALSLRSRGIPPRMEREPEVSDGAD
jgi:uncharacterized membrane protein